MTSQDPPTADTMAQVARLVGSEEKARELAADLSDTELRMVIRAQQAESSEEDQRAMTQALLDGTVGWAPSSDHRRQRLLDAWPDPHAMASALPRPPIKRAMLIALSVFVVAFALVVLLVSFAMLPPAEALLLDLGSIAAYLLIRAGVKRWGIASSGAFTVAADGSVRMLSGAGKVRRKARGQDDDRVTAKTFGFAALALVVVLGLPVAVAVGLDFPELMWGWLVCMSLAMNESVLLASRVRSDETRRGAERFEASIGVELATDFVRRGGDGARLLAGISIRDLLPDEEERRQSVLTDAFIALSFAEATRET